MTKLQNYIRKYKVQLTSKLQFLNVATHRNLSYGDFRIKVTYSIKKDIDLFIYKISTLYFLNPSISFTSRSQCEPFQ
jgi:hypothetical protein